MTKYYNKEIPDNVHVMYGVRESGKSYYELKKKESKETIETIKKFYSKPLWIIMSILSILFYSWIITYIISK